jgi:hypothetical protein
LIIPHSSPGAKAADAGIASLLITHSSRYIPHSVATRLLFLFVCLVLLSFQNMESHLRGRLIDPKTGKGTASRLIRVMQGTTQIGLARTGNKGKFAVDFTVSPIDSNNHNTWVSVYAVRAYKDTVLIEQFRSYPQRLTNAGDPYFSGDYYLPR